MPKGREAKGDKSGVGRRSNRGNAGHRAVLYLLGRLPRRLRRRLARRCAGRLRCRLLEGKKEGGRQEEGRRKAG